MSEPITALSDTSQYRTKLNEVDQPIGECAVAGDLDAGTAGTHVLPLGALTASATGHYTRVTQGAGHRINVAQAGLYEVMATANGGAPTGTVTGAIQFSSGGNRGVSDITGDSDTTLHGIQRLTTNSWIQITAAFTDDDGGSAQAMNLLIRRVRP